jgi:hypothetical protein
MLIKRSGGRGRPFLLLQFVLRIRDASGLLWGSINVSVWLLRTYMHKAIDSPCRLLEMITTGVDRASWSAVGLRSDMTKGLTGSIERLDWECPV